jgi:hypothetical protein
MIIYSPTDGDALMSNVPCKPRHCFLMTQLGKPISPEIAEMRNKISIACSRKNFTIIDARSSLTGRDFLLKIWRQIASTPLAIGVCHEVIPPKTQANIFYELGVAQALGKETLLIASPNAHVPSDLVRSEHIRMDSKFFSNFRKFFAGIFEQAEHYKDLAFQLDRNPVLALDYLRRAYLITGDIQLRQRARTILGEANLSARARNSVEILAATF